MTSQGVSNAFETTASVLFLALVVRRDDEPWRPHVQEATIIVSFLISCSFHLPIFRHSGGFQQRSWSSRNPALQDVAEALDPGFRRDDELGHPHALKRRPPSFS